jgi:hypothetical protein
MLGGNQGGKGYGKNTGLICGDVRGTGMSVEGWF